MRESKSGVVMRFGARGFGFLSEPATRQTYFVHVNDVIGHLILQAGDRVTFEAAPSAIPGKAPSAIQVRLISSPDRVDHSLCERVFAAPPDSNRVIRPADQQSSRTQLNTAGGDQ